MYIYFLNLIHHMRFPLKGSNINPLLKLIDYEFNDQSLILNALTHRSRGANNNERLEFLGDSILNFVIAEALYHLYPGSLEGELSRLRAYLVKGDTLAEIALDLSLGNYVQLGQGELKSGGFRRASILADCVEAMIAAVFLDSGFDDAKKVILKIYQVRLKDKEIFQKLKDSKTLLQEHLQSKGIALPKYELVKVTGEQHNQLFHVSCVVKKLALKNIGKGTTRRKAEKNVADLILEMLNIK